MPGTRPRPCSREQVSNERAWLEPSPGHVGRYAQRAALAAQEGWDGATFLSCVMAVPGAQSGGPSQRPADGCTAGPPPTPVLTLAHAGRPCCPAGTPANHLSLRMPHLRPACAANDALGTIWNSPVQASLNHQCTPSRCSTVANPLQIVFSPQLYIHCWALQAARGAALETRSACLGANSRD